MLQTSTENASAMGLSFVGKVRKQAKKHSRNWPPLAGKKFLKEKGLEFENENSLTHSKTSFLRPLFRRRKY